MASQTYLFRVSRFRRSLSGLGKPVRVVQLSDFHYGPWIHAESVRAWVRAAQLEKPDLIVITGDLLDNDSRGSVALWIKLYLSKPVGLLLDQLSHLKAPLGVYAVWGNHDYGYSNLKTFEASLSSLGISVLTNRGASVRQGLFLARVDDLWWGIPTSLRPC